MKNQPSQKTKILLYVDDYHGLFYKKVGTKPRRKISSMGNAGISLDTAKIMKKAGLDVEIIDLTE